MGKVVEIEGKSVVSVLSILVRLHTVHNAYTLLGTSRSNPSKKSLDCVFFRSIL